MRRILVIANETADGPALREQLVERATHGPVQVFVVCPALNSRLRHWLSDEDGARVRAEQRLRASLAALTREGIDADGVVGDADPVVALADGLRMFRAGEVIVSDASARALELARAERRPARASALAGAGDPRRGR
jgi:hypothetical protein